VWQAYFPFATIIGCDILDKTRLKTRRTKIYVVDQSSKFQLEELCKKESAFDIIIDDGSHFNAHQISTFETLIDALNPEGLYIIEDVQTSFWSHSGWDGAPISDPRFDSTCVGYFLRLAACAVSSRIISRAPSEKEPCAVSISSFLPRPRRSW
jgi:hypothetical protein